MDSKLRSNIVAFFEDKFQQHGATPKGVDWNSEVAQKNRFSWLLKSIGDIDQSSSILDFGCGYGGFLPYLRQHSWTGEYVGYDITKPLISEARRAYKNDPKATFIDDAPIPKADILIACGIFSMKQSEQIDTWEDHIKSTILEISQLAKSHLAFNMLSSYSDADKKRPDLYYANPCYWFEFCKANISNLVAIHHDFSPWEFNLIIRRQKDAAT